MTRGRCRVHRTDRCRDESYEAPMLLNHGWALGPLSACAGLVLDVHLPYVRPHTADRVDSMIRFSRSMPDTIPPHTIPLRLT